MTKLIRLFISPLAHQNVNSPNISLVSANDPSHVYYQAPFYNGEWKIFFDSLHIVHGPVLPKYTLQEIENQARAKSAGPVIGLNLSKLPKNAIPQLTAPPASESNNSRRHTKGGRLMVTRRANNNIRQINYKKNIVNIKSNRKTKNRRQSRKMNALPLYPQPLMPGAIDSYNAMIKMGLIDSILVRLSGRPLKYKTAN